VFAAYTVLSQDAADTFGPIPAMFRAFGVASFLWLLFQAPQGLPTALVEPANSLLS
jgi:hypothetical protein